MHKQRIILLLVLAALCLVYVVGQADGFEYGRVENGQYRNRFFGLTLPVPPGWQAQTEQQMKAAKQEGVERLAGDDQARRARLEAAENRSAGLLVLAPGPDSTEDYRPTLVLTAEKLADLPGVSTSQQYMYNLRQTLTHSSLRFTFGEEPRPVELDHQSFQTLEITPEIEGTTVHAVYYVTIRRGYALVLMTSYATPQQQRTMQQLVQRIRFE